MKSVSFYSVILKLRHFLLITIGIKLDAHARIGVGLIPYLGDR